MTDKRNEMPEELRKQMDKSFSIDTYRQTLQDKFKDIVSDETIDFILEHNKRIHDYAFNECFELMRESEAALQAENEKLTALLKLINAHGLCHYEDCGNAAYGDDPCHCGAEKIELDILRTIGGAE